jgi:hypothetical protein
MELYSRGRRLPLALLALALLTAPPILRMASGPTDERRLQGSPPAPIPPPPAPPSPTPLQALEASRPTASANSLGPFPDPVPVPPAVPAAAAPAPAAAPPPVASAAASTAVAVPNGSGGLGKVAVLIIGQLRGYFQSTEKTMHFLTEPLRRDFSQVRHCVVASIGPARVHAACAAEQLPVVVRAQYTQLPDGRWRLCSHPAGGSGGLMLAWRRIISQVDIFMCVDKPNGPKMRDKKVGGVAPVWVREYTSRTMFLRMKQCYTDVLSDAKQRGV